MDEAPDTQVARVETADGPIYVVSADAVSQIYEDAVARLWPETQKTAPTPKDESGDKAGAYEQFT